MPQPRIEKIFNSFKRGEWIVMSIYINSPVDELYKCAQDLAREHQTTGTCLGGVSPKHQLNKDVRILNSICQGYRILLMNKATIPSAGEWLVDNLYLINEQAQFVGCNLSRRHCRRLPVLKNGSNRGSKRIYIIARKLLEHTGGQANPKLLEDFLWQYQQILPLTMGELWVVPVVLRIAIINKLRRLFEEINRNVLSKQQAHLILQRINPLLSGVSMVIQRVITAAEKYLDLTNPSVLIHLARQFREFVESTMLLRWLEARTATQNLSLAQLIEAEHKRQSEYRVAAGQLISSLREISHTIWENHFEEISTVEQILRRDPAGVYAEMDFASRDLVRHTLENLAKRWGIAEWELAEQTLALAMAAKAESIETKCQQHVGYYLLGPGRANLGNSLKVRYHLHFHHREILIHYPNAVYFTSLIFLTAIFIYAAWDIIKPLHLFTTWQFILFALLLIIPAVEWALRQLHWFLTKIFPPQPLLKLEFRNGIPPEAATMVVIPTIINSIATANELAHRLEIYHLANPDPYIYFALLTDFPDAPRKEMPEDAAILNAALESISRLNARYPHPECSYFYLFHRHRLWNPSEGRWMGWERKRGKLVEFNALLCGSGRTNYTITSGGNSCLSTIRYIITLDSDTQLPRDAAVRLIGALAHPLNAPVLNAEKTQIVSGYGLLQPRISVSNASTNRSLFAALFGGKSGIDVYSGAVSDPYQDLFLYGIFTGKGIYDVCIFHQLLGKRIPENMVLSHDLLEGGFLHAGLVTDVELIDDYPSTYLSSLTRMYRWVRGDWQLLPWLARLVRDISGRKTSVLLPLITRWQIVDNLRRSLLGPVLWALIWFGLIIWPKELALVKIPFIVVGGISLVSYLMNMVQGIHQGTRFSQYIVRPIFNLLVLPYHSLTMIDAVARTLFRLFISHRRLMEWLPAADEGKFTPTNFLGVWRKMSGGQLWIIGTLALAIRLAPAVYTLALPLTLFWLSAPFWVYLISLPRREPTFQIQPHDQLYLRDIALRTWYFFEKMVGPEDHWLPPDNLQVDPPNGIAHRTSPTNIGFLLAVTVSARDFGYITTTKMLERLTFTIDTLETLPRWNGHFYNWYQTVTLEPLQPIYISMVDSGNLVVFLLAVKQAIKEIINSPLINVDSVQGLLDLIRYESGTGPSIPSSINLGLEALIREPPQSVSGWYQALDHLIREAPPNTKFTTVLRELLDELEEAESATVLDKIHTGGDILLKRMDALVVAHDFTQLYDPKSRLFSIGYNLSNKQLDPSYYDLLASEARQTSFVAIALGQIPTKHWFALNRSTALSGRKQILASWNGTMFEYLMPLLLMPSFPNTLWDQTYRLVVKQQMSYAMKAGLPWGISESGYYDLDFQKNYQYQAFGIPGLGLRQGLESDRVIAPYATFLAAPIALTKAIINLRRLERFGVLGEFGFYEAIDFTPSRLPKGSQYAVVKSFMAHHQGMILLSLENILLANRFQRRFIAEPRVKATESLLRERIPARSLVVNKKPFLMAITQCPRDENIDLRSFYNIDTPLPEARFLSNGNYLVMVTNGGGSFSRWRNIALNCWSEDPIRDVHGAYFYIRNLTDNMLWSPSYQPCRVSAADAAMRFSLEKIAFTRTDGDIHTNMEICVSPELDAEVRQITLTNHGDAPYVLEVTSFMELALASAADFKAHPAFSKLFIETEVIPETKILLAHRRSEKPDNQHPWAFHLVQVEGHTIGPLEYETDRSRFVGRGRSTSLPQVIKTNQRLSGTVGMVLDPIFSLRRCVKLSPGRSARLTFVTGIAASREQAIENATKLRSPFQLVRTFDLAWSRNQIELRELGITPQLANLFQWMTSQVFYFNPYRPNRSKFVTQNTKGQSGLWAYGISGDLPLVLVRLADHPELDLVQTMLKAFQYWQLKGFQIDLVILNEFEGNYQETLQKSLLRLIEGHTDPGQPARLGKVFLLSGKAIPESGQILLETVAKFSLRGDQGNLVTQLLRSNPEPAARPARRSIQTPPGVTTHLTPSKLPEELLFFNSWGGFTPSGNEYVIQLKAKDLLPMPWINVIANPHFGFQVSESGGGYTWALNSREFRISPWSNDPVLDYSGEICYLRDEESGMLWSLTALPIREAEAYIIRHGQGYTTFTHLSQGIDQTGLLFVPLSEPVKILRLTLRNTEDRPRVLAITYYIDWVLGDCREKTAPYIVTESDPMTGALLARNVYQDNFADQVGFLQIWADQPLMERSWTGDRAEFIGRNGSLSHPAALEQVALSNRTGADFNPCGAMQVKITLLPGSECTINILLGSASSLDKIQAILAQYSQEISIEAAIAEVRAFWDGLLGQVRVTTPDPGFNLLMNRWLIYQTLACRIWARSAFYQSGGAYGFRDQLQDSLALLHTRPELARGQILHHAGHQYCEGDVQHWWHEETHRGIRTKVSDDLLWLPYTACYYAERTGDTGIWQESIPFLEDAPLGEAEFERYGPTKESPESASLYEHCIRAINRALHFGEHGLPLMGSGDWNDSMNMVGQNGRGESVWLGWFLYSVLQAMIPVCSSRQDLQKVREYSEIMEHLAHSLDEHAWDGNWYRRAYNDNGEPLGSQQNSECQIDCIAQAWAVLSGAAPRDKAVTAMESLDYKLVSPEDSLIRLLTPPFVRTEPAPGYIQSYPPGVRENGGQYTHAAIWAVIAWAKLREGNRAYELFRLLNPIYHARTDHEVQHYKVEPYVMASDVYSVPPYVGRGGWTWYTGAAGWMYQAGLEWLLGIKKQGSKLVLNPCIPEDWPELTIDYQYYNTGYQILIKNPDGKQTGGVSLELDGQALPPNQALPLVDDGGVHRVVLIL
jgi:cellobiose phosphorylase